MDTCRVVSFVFYRAGWYTGNAVYVYSRCAWLKSRLGRRIPLVNSEAVLHGLPQFPQKNVGIIHD